MQCLNNYIGVRALVENCNYPKSVSGLYLEDLEGMTLARVSDIESGKNQSAQKAVEQLLNRAGMVMMNEVKILLTPYWRTEAALEGGRLGVFNETIGTGAELNIESYVTPLSSLVISEISVKLDHSGTVTITLEDGSHTETKDVDVVSGVEKFIPWLYVSKTSKVKFSTPHDGYNGSLHSAWRLRSRHCNTAPYEFCCCNTTSKSVNGITATFAVQCLPETFLCESLPHINQALLYSLGIEVLKEWESSDRLNFLAIYGKEWATEKRNEWQQIRNELITASIPGIARYLEKVDRRCFTCGGFSYAYSHP